ncbi:hypothetical protein [Halobacterium zhouii]|uniref:hypothetical protein n=1 Tax=Halobacterium zhouii TaxID=2902624 RepID=UPI001E5491AF|nr:hypothetical protein [Halobacterium zhouii]
MAAAQYRRTMKKQLVTSTQPTNRGDGASSNSRMGSAETSEIRFGSRSDTGNGALLVDDHSEASRVVLSDDVADGGN